MRARVLDGLQRAMQVIDVAAAAFPFKAIMVVALWILAPLPLFIMLCAATVGSLLAAVRDTALGFVIGRGALLLGRMSLPPLVGKAALGSDRGRFLEVRELPPGVTAPEAISDALTKEAALISRRFGESAGSGAFGAIARMEAFEIKAYVTNALTDTALAHSFYYRSPEIRERISRLIAAPPPAFALPPLGTGWRPRGLIDWSRIFGPRTPTGPGS
jgi:hypothetical protein